ncbi:DUF6093 family protein [Streptomyces sp. NPDC001156]
MSSPIALAAAAPILARIMVDTVQIFRPGPEVLDPDSGVYVPGPDIIIYCGLGAIFSAGGPGLVVAVAGQPVLSLLPRTTDHGRQPSDTNGCGWRPAHHGPRGRGRITSPLRSPRRSCAVRIPSRRSRLPSRPLLATGCQTSAGAGAGR